MSTFDQVRQALATAVSQAGITCHARYPGSVTPPAAVVRRGRTHYGTQFNGGHSGVLLVSVYLPASEALTSGEQLDAYLDASGPKSIRAAVLADTTLGGVVRSIVTSVDTDVEEEALVTLSGVDVLAGTVPFDVVFE